MPTKTAATSVRRELQEDRRPLKPGRAASSASSSNSKSDSEPLQTPLRVQAQARCPADRKADRQQPISEGNGGGEGGKGKGNWPTMEEAGRNICRNSGIFSASQYSLAYTLLCRNEFNFL